MYFFIKLQNDKIQTNQCKNQLLNYSLINNGFLNGATVTISWNSKRFKPNRRCQLINNDRIEREDIDQNFHHSNILTLILDFLILSMTYPFN
jgi:hypothetical protein